MARYNKELGAFILEGPRKEREDAKKREVVRVFVFRSKSTEQIKNELAAGADPVWMSFTTVMWAEKDSKDKGTENPDQMMPVGGKRKKGASLETDAARELMEEAHLRADRFEPLGNMKYTFLHSKEGWIANDATFLATTVVPSAVAYPLHPEEDKIRRLHYLDANQTADILTRGHLPAPGVRKPGEPAEVKVLDSLLFEESNEARESAFRMQLALMEKFQQREFEKKKDVLAACADLMRRRNIINQEEAEKIFQEIETARNLMELTGIYVNFFRKHSVKDASTRDIFCRAFDLANFKEEVRKENAGKSRMEAVIRLVYTLMNTEYYGDEYLDAAEENDNLKDFIKRLKSFLHAVSPGSKTAAEQAKVIGGVAEDEEQRERIEKEFLRAFDIPADEVRSRLENIDRFLYDTVRRGVDPLIKSKHSRRLLEQTNEVQGAGLGKLLLMAFPTGGGAPWKERYRGGSGWKRGAFPLESAVFEARRKLAMLYLFAPAEEYYRRMRELNSGNVIGEAIFEKMSSAPVVGCDVREVRDENGELADIEARTNGQGEGEEEAPYTMIRRLDGQAGGDQVGYYADIEKLPLKDLEQLFRKLVVRGFDEPEAVRDLYRRTIVLVASAEKEDASRLKTREKRSIAGVTDERGKELREVEDIQAVLDVVERIAAQPGARVVGYKSTPRKQERYRSRGVGGMGEVRFAKFYIEYTDAKGVAHYEEAQIFAPSEDGKSGFYYKRKKEEDDARYFVDRLLQTRGLRSFMELLFPEAIYDKPAYLMRQKNEEAKARR